MSFPVETDLRLVDPAHQELHSLVIVHRDISAGNILIRAKPNLQLAPGTMDEPKEITMDELPLDETEGLLTDFFEFAWLPELGSTNSNSQTPNDAITVSISSGDSIRQSLTVTYRVLILGYCHVHGEFTCQSHYIQERATTP